MDDIFLDDPRQISAKAVSAKNKAERKLKKRRFREYFADWIIKSLICAVLIGIDFTLFAEAGSYSLFDNTQTLNTEAIIIYSAIAAVSFAILFLLSFSLFLQDLFTAIIAGFFVLAVLTQFALFDRHSVLDSLFGQYFGSGISSILMTSSHLVIAGAAGIPAVAARYGRDAPAVNLHALERGASSCRMKLFGIYAIFFTC